MTTIDELYAWGDVGLFDLKSGPSESKNLAIGRNANATLIMTMSAKLAAVIKSEIGKDAGREMPNIPTVDCQQSGL